MENTKAITEFFKNYKQNFLRSDIDSIANSYLFPVCFFTFDGSKILMDEETFKQNCQALLKKYNSLKIEFIDFQIESLQRINMATYDIKIRWLIIIGNQKESSFNTQYILTLKNEECKILNVIEIDESKTVDN